jgi:CheY-like chemotaxis protein
VREPILIVDDSSDNRELTQILLDAEGFETKTAADAVQALWILKIYRPALILMDIQLPGIGGLELTRMLRKDPAFQNVVIVAVSAYAMASDKKKARAAGCDGYITKPIDTRTFAATVCGYLGARSALPTAR